MFLDFRLDSRGADSNPFLAGGTYIISLTAELPEGLDVEPGALVARVIQ